MIYLIQDCYEDKEGNFQKILKIGYSSKTFMEGRKSQYDTHNYGYKLLSEREGSLELERYLHRRLQKYHLSLEWFKYDPEVIKIFNEVSEDDISQFKSQEELNEYIRDYILENLIPSTKKLSNLYLKGILEELHEKSKEYPELEYNEDLLKKEILEVFEFVSSREKKYFENLNFDDKEVKKLLSNTGLNLSQIVGRQRYRENPFKNTISVFYKTTGNLQSREEFDRVQEERRNETRNLLEGFENLTKEQQISYVSKLRDSIQVSQYSRDFVSISSKTGQPVHNSFIELADERAWEVSQKDYQDRIAVTKVMEEKGYFVSEDNNQDNVPEDFKAIFNRTNIFAEKLKIYCEYLDFISGDQRLTDIVKFSVKDPDYQKFYEFYGTKGCKAKLFQRGELERGMKDTLNLEVNKNQIYNLFEVGKRYTLKDIKLSLGSLYRSNNISKTPKAKDLEEYFNVTEVKIYDPVTKKQSKGYLIVSRK